MLSKEELEQRAVREEEEKDWKILARGPPQQAQHFERIPDDDILRTGWQFG
jgi:hypothetical protein